MKSAAARLAHQVHVSLIGVLRVRYRLVPAVW
jgi:hypothetical protein